MAQRRRTGYHNTRNYAKGGAVKRTGYQEGGYAGLEEDQNVNQALDTYYRDPLEDRLAKLRQHAPQGDDTVYGSTRPAWSEDAYNASMMQSEQGYARGGAVRRGYAGGGAVPRQNFGDGGAASLSSLGSWATKSQISKAKKKFAEHMEAMEAVYGKGNVDPETGDVSGAADAQKVRAEMARMAQTPEGRRQLELYWSQRDSSGVTRGIAEPISGSTAGLAREITKAAGGGLTADVDRIRNTTGSTTASASGKEISPKEITPRDVSSDTSPRNLSNYRDEDGSQAASNEPAKAPDYADNYGNYQSPFADATDYTGSSDGRNITDFDGSGSGNVDVASYDGGSDYGGGYQPASYDGGGGGNDVSNYDGGGGGNVEISSYEPNSTQYFDQYGNLVPAEGSGGGGEQVAYDPAAGGGGGNADAGYNRGGAVKRRTGYQEGGEVEDESAGLNTGYQGNTDAQDAVLREQERQARELAAQQAQQEEYRRKPATLADRDAAPQPDVQAPAQEPIGDSTAAPPELSRPPEQAMAAAAPSPNDMGPAPQGPSTVQDILASIHKRYGIDTPAEVAPPTGYGGAGPSDIASRQAEQSRQTMAGRASEGMTPLGQMTGDTGVGTLVGGAIRRGAEQVGSAIGRGAQAFTDKLTSPDEYDAASGKLISSLKGGIASYIRGDHAAPAAVLDKALADTAAANPNATPASVAVQAITNEKLDPDQKAGLLGGMQQRYQTTNAMAQGAIAHGDIQSAMRLAQEAHNHVPDGQNLVFRQEGDRIIATVDPLGAKPPVSYSMNRQQFHDYLVGPATSFDHVVINGVQKNLEIASGGTIVRDATGYTTVKAPASDANAAADSPAPAALGYSPVNMPQARQRLEEVTGNTVTPTDVSALAPGERTPMPAARPQEANDIRPWGGNLSRPEVGYNKEATRELGGQGDVRSLDANGRQIPGTSAHKPPGAGAFYRDVTLIRSPSYEAMQRDQGAVPIRDRNGYVREWLTKPGTNDFDPVPPSAYTAKPGTVGTPRGDGTYADNPAPIRGGTTRPTWDPNREGQGAAQPQRWQMPSGRGVTGAPPPADDQSMEAKAFRMYPSSGDSEKRNAMLTHMRDQESKEFTANYGKIPGNEKLQLEYDTLDNLLQRTEVGAEAKQQIAGMMGELKERMAVAAQNAHQKRVETGVAGRKSLQEDKDARHAERQQNWINFRQDKTAQDIAQKTMTSRENQLIKMYDTAIMAGTKPIPEAEAAAKKLAAAVNDAGYRTPDLPHVQQGAAASQAASTAAAGQVPVTPSASMPAQPPSVPPGSSYSPSRQQWRAPDGRIFGANGAPVGP